MTFLDSDSEFWHELASLAASEGLELYDVERFADSGLRVVIDRSGTSSPEMTAERISSEDCTRFCKRLMVHFSVNGESFGLSSEPEIEVASPGINRVLRTSDHFRGAIGERIKVVWQERVDKAPTNTTVGVLQEVLPSELSVLDERSGEPLRVVFEHVRKAHVDFPF